MKKIGLVAIAAILGYSLGHIDRGENDPNPFKRNAYEEEEQDILGSNLTLEKWYDNRGILHQLAITQCDDDMCTQYVDIGANKSADLVFFDTPGQGSGLVYADFTFSDKKVLEPNQLEAFTYCNSQYLSLLDLFKKKEE